MNKNLYVFTNTVTDREGYTIMDEEELITNDNYVSIIYQLLVCLKNLNI